jgi:hypothetical protein
MQVKIEISEKATVDRACSVLLAHTREFFTPESTVTAEG